MSPEMHEAGRLTVLGWTAFALYLAAALSCFRAAAVAIRSRSSAVSRQGPSQTARFWLWFGVILALLGLNKPVNLQTRLIELGRQIAGGETLAAHRAGLHVAFFLGFLALVIAFLAALRFRFAADMGRVVRELPLAAGGSILIFIYILVRAISIAGVDHVLGLSLGHVPFLWLLEAGGLLLIIVQSLRKPDENVRI